MLRCVLYERGFTKVYFKMHELKHPWGFKTTKYKLIIRFNLLKNPITKQNAAPQNTSYFREKSSLRVLILNNFNINQPVLL